jgi:uncharacterized protein YgbK (DUF1537 family)
MYIGAIADDLTGGTDLALMLKREGMRVRQVIGVPERLDASGIDAVVVSLKSRTAPVAEAVSQSLASVRALRSAGAQQLFFKYCSTFDSTDEGNIGPVADALIEETGAKSMIFCPAFPANKRTVYQGHLFVGRQLLSDSPMRDHPLTPMRDANLVRVLARQSKHAVGMLPLEVVEQEAEAIRAAIEAEAAAGRPFIVVDALNDMHLHALGLALAGAPLVSGGSGIAMGLPANFGIEPPDESKAERMPAPAGRALILAGSCSEATRRQIAAALDAGLPGFCINPLAIADCRLSSAAVKDWLAGQKQDRPALIYASAAPDEVAAVQTALGAARASELIEALLADIAESAIVLGVTRMIVAGGETSGAVVGRLGVRALDIGPEIAPGVPWTLVEDGPPLALALKSGNFGGDDMFLSAWDWLA